MTCSHVTHNLVPKTALRQIGGNGLNVRRLVAVACTIAGGEFLLLLRMVVLIVVSETKLQRATSTRVQLTVCRVIGSSGMNALKPVVKAFAIDTEQPRLRQLLVVHNVSQRFKMKYVTDQIVQ
jgi:hypothetical protein